MTDLPVVIVNAKHALGRFARGFPHVLMAVATFASGCSPPKGAPAKTGRLVGDWVDPSGRISLSFRSQGWRPINPMRSQGDVLEIAGPKDANGRTFMCSVMQPRSGGLLGGSQAQINAYMDGRTEADLPAEWTGAQGFRLSHIMVDGVSVLDMHFARRGFYQHWRTFRLPAAIGTTQYTLSCGASLPVTAEDQAELESILTSLRISQPH